jgi:hypothetical protein
MEANTGSDEAIKFTYSKNLKQRLAKKLKRLSI